MPDEATTQKAEEDLREGKSPSTAAGEFVREEIEHVREGKHGARSPQQAIAIGLSKARRAGIPLKPPAEGKDEGKHAGKRGARLRARAIGRGKKGVATEVASAGEGNEEGANHHGVASGAVGTVTGGISKARQEQPPGRSGEGCANERARRAAQRGEEGGPDERLAAYTCWTAWVRWFNEDLASP